VRAQKDTRSTTQTTPAISGKTSGLVNVTSVKPGQSGKLAGRTQGDARIRRLLNQSLNLCEKEALAAFRRRWASTRYCQDMSELLAMLEGELSKEAAEGAGRYRSDHPERLGRPTAEPPDVPRNDDEA
jgi:hypothetical protein